MRRRLVPLFALAAAALGTCFAATASAEVGAFVVHMTGEAERPGPGDPDAFGYATVVINSDTGEVCVRLRVFNMAPATAAHIHVGGPSEPGPVVVPLPAPTNGRSSGCVSASTALLQRIVDNPANYYVNVHNLPFPGGAVRGQLQ